jgi:hypothetical protein
MSHNFDILKYGRKIATINNNSVKTNACKKRFRVLFFPMKNIKVKTRPHKVRKMGSIAF